MHYTVSTWKKIYSENIYSMNYTSTLQTPWRAPGDLYLIDFVTAISTSKELGSGTNDPAICTIVYFIIIGKIALFEPQFSLQDSARFVIPGN
jgi:hypothetical protein